MQHGNDVQKLLQENEAARRLGFGLSTLRHWRYERRRPAHIQLARNIPYLSEDLDPFIAARTQGGRTHGGTFKRGKRFYFKFKDAAGQWQEKAIGTEGLKEAKSIKRKFLEDLEDGRLPNNRAAWRFGQVLDEWLLHRQQRIRPASLASQKSIIRALRSFFGEGTPLIKWAQWKASAAMKRTV